MESQALAQSAPVALTIAGSDSGANAGIQADLLSFAANGVYGTTAVTCITAQNPNGVTEIHPIPTETVAAQIRQIENFYSPKAIKTGMLYSESIIDAVCSGISRMDSRSKIIVDPVTIATSGTALIDEAAINRIQAQLLPLADLVTPNLDEAEALAGRPVRTLTEINDAARALSRKYETAILIKGGHLLGNELVDTLCLADGTLSTYSQKRILNINTHGSGCTLSSSITAWVVRGFSIHESVSKGLDYTQAAMENPILLNGKCFINHFP